MKTTFTKHKALLQQVNTYYTAKLREYGPTHSGVDWNSIRSQNLRFDKLLKIMGDEKTRSVLDYGCGYGAMARYIRRQGYTGKYTGFDISEAMISTARQLQASVPMSSFASSTKALRMADYTMASGIFNVKQKQKNSTWLEYILDTIRIMARYSRKGFSFNMLTSYSDKEKMRPYLYYADPRIIMDHCIRTYSRHVAILHDYELYEFTVLVRMA